MSYTIALLMAKSFSAWGSSRVRFVLTLLLLLFGSLTAIGQQLDPNLYGGLRWRMIGPHRGGRSVAVSGVEG
ncbi:MAG TPA: hypothetical protein VE133_12065, partial [Candidatus Sulfotelmatobacter sp.]|nr:hypothetical protein [Candidatus Sulfotelmatobacter sp.]